MNVALSITIAIYIKLALLFFIAIDFISKSYNPDEISK
jgi:hypothetical protein